MYTNPFDVHKRVNTMAIFTLTKRQALAGMEIVAGHRRFPRAFQKTPA